MTTLTPDGQRVVAELSSRFGFSPDAVTHMMFAVLNGNGSMAQFNHGEFAGGGQWMSGGMTMLGDMFNGQLKGRVDGLCSAISNILAAQPGLLQSGSFQSQSQGGGGGQQQSSGGSRGASSLFVPDPEQNWWPAELGSPSASGSQNNVKYAYFSNARRLAVKTGTEVWVYDTQNHQIGGFSQQQGSGGSITFSSQYGTVILSQLPAISRNGQPVAVPTMPATPAASHAPATPAASPSRGDSNEVLGALERLGELRSKGVVSDEEFAAKKRELLARL